MDKSSFSGVLIAVGGILAGMMVEGGKIGQILQPTAAMIVFGGTLGAVMLQFPLATVLAAARIWPGFSSARSRTANRSAADGEICQQGATQRDCLARSGSGNRRGPISQTGPDARRGWHRPGRIAQDHATGSRQPQRNGGAYSSVFESAGDFHRRSALSAPSWA